MYRYYDYIEDKVFTEWNTECWLWHSVNKDGYGRGVATGTGPKNTITPHRLAYTLRYGAIPEGLQIDHKCNTPACYNPEHLQLATAQENIARSERATKTHCVNGHPLEGANLYYDTKPGGYRQRSCKLCRKEINRRQYERRKTNV